MVRENIMGSIATCTSYHWIIIFLTISYRLPNITQTFGFFCISCCWHASQSFQGFTWSSIIQIWIVDIKLGIYFLKQDQPPRTSWRRRIIKIIPTVISSKHWKLIIDGDTYSISSYIEESFKSTGWWIFSLCKDILNAIWALSQSYCCRQEPTVSKISLFRGFHGNSSWSPKRWLFINVRWSYPFDSWINFSARIHLSHLIRCTKVLIIPIKRDTISRKTLINVFADDSKTLPELWRLQIVSEIVFPNSIKWTRTAFNNRILCDFRRWYIGKLKFLNGLRNLRIRFTRRA